MANASDCGSEDRGFESHHSPHTNEMPSPVPQAGEGTTQSGRFQPVCRILGCRQVVRHQTLTLAFAGSSPAIPAKSLMHASHGLETLMADGRTVSSTVLGGISSPIEAGFDGAQMCKLRTARKRQCPPALSFPSMRAFVHNDPLAQSVEQLPFKQWVRGSNPRRVTSKKTSFVYRQKAFF